MKSNQIIVHFTEIEKNSCVSVAEWVRWQLDFGRLQRCLGQSPIFIDYLTVLCSFFHARFFPLLGEHFPIGDSLLLITM